MAPKGKPTPAQAPEEAEVTVDVGSTIRFLGYAADTAPEDQLLKEGGEYEIVQLPEAVEDGQPGEMTGFIVVIANPSFDETQEVSEDNPEEMEVEVFEDEFEVLGAAIEGEVVEEEEQAEEAPPAPAKGKATSKAKATAAPAKAAPEKGKATTTKGKATAPAKAEKPAKAPAVPKEEEELPDLENEDESVLAMVEGQDANGLIGLAQGIESDNAENEFRLGGLLYKIKKDGSWKELDPEYKENGGWPKFLQDYFNTPYRKGQHLIEIYVTFTQAGIENPAEVMARLGWTKAQKLVKPLVDQMADAPVLIEQAENASVADLSEIIKEMYTEAPAGGEAKEKAEQAVRVTMKFRYVKEDAEVADSTLKAAAEQYGCKADEALLQILGDWATRNLGNKATPATKVAETEAAPAAKVAPAKKTTTAAPAKAAPAAKKTTAAPAKAGAAKAAPAKAAPAKATTAAPVKRGTVKA